MGGVLYNRFLPIDPVDEEAAAAEKQNQPPHPSSIVTDSRTMEDTTPPSATPGVIRTAAATIEWIHRHHHHHDDEHGCTSYDDEDSWPDTPEPSAPSSVSETTANGGNYASTFTLLAGPDQDDRVAAAAAASSKQTTGEASFLDVTTTAWDKLCGAVTAFSKSLSVVGVLGATVMLFHTLQGFLGLILEPSARLLWHGLGWVLATVRSVVIWFLGALLQVWHYIHAPNDILEFATEVPSDPTIYDHDTVRRLLMTMNYDDNDEGDNDWTFLPSTIKALVWEPFRDHCEPLFWKEPKPFD